MRGFMTRTQWAWLLAVLLVEVCALIVVFAATDPHYPTGFGFAGTRDQWQLFWITFWSTSFPTIATAAIITVLAGRYLNDRERRLDQRVEEQVTTQRHRESMEWLQHRLASAFDESTDMRFGDVPKAREVFSPRMQAVHKALTDQSWPLWRRSLPDMDPLFVWLHAVDDAFRRCGRAADLFDRDLVMAMRLVGQRAAFSSARPVVQRVPDQLAKQFIIGCAVGLAPGLLALTLSGDVRYRDLLDEVWAAARIELPEIAGSADRLGQAYADLTDALKSLQAFIQAAMEQGDQSGGVTESVPS